MLLERLMKLGETLGRDTLAQQFFAAQISDAVNHDTAHRRSGRGHEHVEQELGTILIHVGGHDRVHGQPESGAIQRCDGKHSPSPQRLQQPPQERGVTQEYVFDSFQWVSLAVYAN
jgi:hypothetical protein